MKIFASLMTALVLFGASMPTARADATVDIEYFYDSLSPHGDWVQVEGYGYCFQPFVTVDDPEWRPYTDGNWAYTDAGWTWVSNEDFGWATYHYGRWMKAGPVWLWVPGDVWAPAWVSWRYSPEYVGWAPLPPEAVWQPEVGFTYAVDTNYDIGPAYYSFVAIRHFGAPRLRTYIEPWRRNVDYVRWTENCTHITYRQTDVRVTNIFIGGPDYVEINRYSERPLRRMSLRRDDTFDPRNRDGDRRSLRVREEGDALVVAAPRVTLGERKAPPAGKIKAKLDKSAVDHGWKGYKQEEVGSVREKLKREVAEAKTRPGRGGPPDARTGPDGTRNRERGPDSTVTPGERAPKALPATPEEAARTLPGTGAPDRGDRTPGMRRPGEDSPPPGAGVPRRLGDTNELDKNRDGRGPGKGPDSIERSRTPDAAERTPVGPTPDARPGMKPKDDDNRGKPEGRRGENEPARPGAGNTVSPVVPRPGGVPPESNRKVTPPTERKPDLTPGEMKPKDDDKRGKPEGRRGENEPARPGAGNTVSPVVPRPGGVPPESNRKVTPTERKPDLTPGESPDRRGRPVRPDSSPNENAIPKPDRTPKPDKAERKMDRTPDAPPSPRKVAPPVAPVPTPQPEMRKPDQPREELRRKPQGNDSPKPQKIERPEAPRPQQIQRPPEAPRPQAPPAAAPGSGGGKKEKDDKKDDDEKGKRGR